MLRCILYKSTLAHTGAPAAHRLRLSVLTLLVLITLFAPQHASAKQGGWEYETYHVQIAVAIDVPGGIAEQLAGELPRYLQRRVEASLIPAWSCTVRLATGADRTRVFENVAAATPAPPSDLPTEKDKLLLATIRWTPEQVELAAREFDQYLQRWGTPIRRESRQEAALPEQVFALVWQAFSPLAQVEPDEKNTMKVVLKPRGALLPRAAGAPPLAKPGDMFLPVLRRSTRSGELEKKDGVQKVAWTYIEATEVKNNAITGRVQSASRHPFAGRKQGRVEQLALALRADPDATTLALHSRTVAKKPLAGYEVYSQKPGEEALTRLGVSDVAGELSIAPAKSPVQFLLIKHGGQLLARVPVVAVAERRLEVPVPDDDARLAAEVRLSAVREDLIDVVARRNILMARIRSKIQKGDFKGAEDLVHALDDLPGRPQFNLTLATAEQTLRSEDPTMQRRIKQLFDATQTLLTQYLDLKPINQVKDELRAAQQKPPKKAAVSPAAAKG
jgi:hypothetical protein